MTMQTINFTVGDHPCDCGACTPHECTPRQSGVYECQNANGAPHEPHDCTGYHCGESWASPECAECGYGHCARYEVIGHAVTITKRSDGRWTVKVDGQPASQRFYSARTAEAWAVANA
jgi:hypothetical protein